jgi:hypothetical protein
MDIQYVIFGRETRRLVCVSVGIRSVHIAKSSVDTAVFHFIDAKFGHFPQNPLLLYLYLYQQE